MREAADAGGQHACCATAGRFRSSASRARSSPEASCRTCSSSPASTSATTTRRGGPRIACVMQSFASFGDPAARRRPREPGAHAARAQLLGHAVRGLRARSPQRAEQPARPRRLRRRTRHPRHHRQSLAARLRARPRRPRGCGLERRSRRPRPSAGSASATSRSRTPTPARMPTRTPRSTRRGAR